MINARKHIGIDLGGTNIRAAVLDGEALTGMVSAKIDAGGGQQQVLQQVFQLVDPLIEDGIAGIGIGVPGLVDAKEKMVYDVVNIPSWVAIRLQQLMEQHYKLPVFAENDANCFALGEYHFGSAKGSPSLVGLTLGTGMGAGLVINGSLYTGRNGGAGEFGMMPYLDHVYEYYASGQFFRNEYQLDGQTVYEQANAGNNDALKMYETFGMHLGNAIMAILLAIDADTIIIGGSVKNAFPFFEKAMWKQIEKFPYQRALRHLRIQVSTLSNSGIYGAASLLKHYPA